MSAQPTDRKWLIATVISVLALFASAASAMYASRQSATASDTAKRQLRPYLFPATGGNEQNRSHLEQFKADEAIYAVTAFENSGQTPVYDFRVFMDIKVLSLPLGNDEDLRAKQRESHQIIGPHGFAFFRLKSDNKVTAPELDAVEKGQKAIYVYGRIEYEDGFRSSHWTDFCLWYANLHDGAGQCGRHNDGDR